MVSETNKDQFSLDTHRYSNKFILIVLGVLIVAFISSLPIQNVYLLLAVFTFQCIFCLWGITLTILFLLNRNKGYMKYHPSTKVLEYRSPERNKELLIATNYIKRIDFQSTENSYNRTIVIHYYKNSEASETDKAKQIKVFLLIRDYNDLLSLVQKLKIPFSLQGVVKVEK